MQFKYSRGREVIRSETSVFELPFLNHIFKAVEDICVIIWRLKDAQQRKVWGRCPRAGNSCPISHSLSLHLQALPLSRDGSLKAAVQSAVMFSPICSWLPWECSRTGAPMGERGWSSGMLTQGPSPAGRNALPLISSRNCSLPSLSSATSPRSCLWPASPSM